MNVLRWILIAVGALLFIGIYMWGRRSSKKSVAEQPPARLQPRPDAAVPQLDEIVGSNPRVSAEPILAHDVHFDASDLPSMSFHGSGQGREEAMEASPSRSPSALPPYDRAPAISSRPAPPTRGAIVEAVFEAPISSTPTPTTRNPTDSAATNRPAGDPPPKRPVPQRKIIALRLAADGSVEGAKLKSLLEAAALVHGKYGIYHRLQADIPLFSVASMVEPGTFDPFAMSGVQFPGVTLFLQLPGPMDGLEMVSSMIACARQLEQGMGGELQDERGLPLTEPRERRLRDDAADFLHLLGE